MPWRRLLRLLLGAGFLCVAWVVLSSMEAQAADSPRPTGLLAPSTSSPLLPALGDVTTTAAKTAANATKTATRTATAPLDGAVGSAVGTTQKAVGQTTRVVEETTSSIPVAGEVVGEVTPVVRDVVEDVSAPVAATVDATLSAVPTKPAAARAPSSGNESSGPEAAIRPVGHPVVAAAPAEPRPVQAMAKKLKAPEVVALQAIPSWGPIGPPSGALPMRAGSVPVPSTASGVSAWGPDSPGPAVPLGPDPQAPPAPATSSSSGPVAGDVAALPLHELLHPAVQSPAGHGPELLTGADPGQPDSRPD